MTADDILSGSFSGRSVFEDAAISFCQYWLTGTKSFRQITSGSTGEPKAIDIPRGRLEASARATIKALSLSSDDVALVCLDTRYIAGKMMLVRSMIAGMQTVLMEPKADPFSMLPDSIQPTFTALVPYQLSAILQVPRSRQKLDNMRLAIIGGASVPPHLDLRQIACSLYATYGMTETVSHVALQRLNGNLVQDYFQGLPGILFGIDGRGCLTISASYLGDEPIITNDLIELLSSQRFRWLGRWDTVINSGGAKIIPERLERAADKILASLEIDRRIFVAGVPDRDLGSRVALFIEGPVLEQSIVNSVTSQLKSVLPAYENPRNVYFIAHFDETASGKIDKRKTIAQLR